MATEIEKFREISKQFEGNNSLTEEHKNSNIDLVKEINFNNFSIEEIEELENCTWLPESFIVTKLRAWMDQDDDVINDIMSYLIFTETIQPDLLREIIATVISPSNGFNHKIDNIIYTLSRASDKNVYLNPVEAKIISVESSQTQPKKDLSKIFEKDPITSNPSVDNIYFSTTPSENNYACFILPDFLSVSLTAYTIKRGPKNFPISWSLEGSNDNEKWTVIDNKSQDQSLCQKQQEVTFEIKEPVGYFRYFKIIQKGLNSDNNSQFVLGGFDISGYAKIVTPSKY